MKEIELKIEELEERIAPAPLFVNPPSGASPSANFVADQGCDNGITPHATAASNGVVSCGRGGGPPVIGPPVANPGGGGAGGGGEISNPLLP